MIFLSNGKIMFNDFGEMYYNLFMELGLSINEKGYLFDQDTGIILKYEDKFIKASLNPEPVYAGFGDIAFEPNKNYRLMMTLLGYYIDKRMAMDDENDQLGYKSNFILSDGNNDAPKQSVCIDTKLLGITQSQYYYNLYLGFIECILSISSPFIPDLSNFDKILNEGETFDDKFKPKSQQKKKRTK